MKSIKILVLVGVMVGMLFAGCGKDEDTRECKEKDQFNLSIGNASAQRWVIYFNDNEKGVLDIGETEVINGLPAGPYNLKLVEIGGMGAELLWVEYTASCKEEYIPVMGY